MTPATEEPSRSRLPWICLLTTGLLTLVLYLPTLGADFVRWDDNINVYENEHIQGLTWANLQWMFADISHALRYKPLSWLAWCLVHEVSGLHPTGYHLLNVALHAANAVLVCLLFAWMLGSADGRPERDWPCAAFGALVWSLHPLRVEPVAWVTGLPYDLSLTFTLIACVFYWRFAASPADAPTHDRLYTASLVAYLLALITYPIILGLCVIPPLMDWWMSRRAKIASPILRTRHLPFLAGAAIMVGVNVLGRMSSNPLYIEAASVGEFSIGHRIMQGFYVWACFLIKNVWTAGLATAYADLFGFDPLGWKFVASAALVIALSAGLFTLRKRFPVPGILWACHLAWLVPVLGLTESRHTPYDRYTYAAGLLFGLLLAIALRQFLARSGRRIALVGAGATLAVFAVQSAAQIRTWRNSETLFLYTITHTDSPFLRSDFWSRLGHWYLLREDFPSAEIAYVNALDGAPDPADLHFRIAFTRFRQKKIGEALPHYEIAHRAGRLKGEFLSDYGVALVVTGELEAALERFAEVVEQEPENPDFRRNLALTLRRLGRDKEAADQERRAADLRNGKRLQ